MLDAFGVVTIGWKLIFLGASVGTLLAYGLEWLLGKYVGTSMP